MSTTGIIVTIFIIGAGLLSFLGGLLDWKWMYVGKNRKETTKLSKTLSVVLGAAVVVFGILCAVGVVNIDTLLNINQ